MDAREVLAYLNELGYTNISASQLKDFMTDLKKIMKYDAYQSSTSKSSTEYEEEYDNYDRENINPYPEKDIFTELYETGTISSKAKMQSKKQSVISLQIKRPKSCPSTHCGPLMETISTQVTPITLSGYSTLPSSTRSEVFTDANTARTERTAERTVTTARTATTARTETTDVKKRSLKPKASFIRPKIPLRIQKTDPVALYHTYQQGWKKQKIPGESSHSHLRWAIREKLMGGEYYY